MRTNSLRPQTFLQNVLADAEKALKKANKGNTTLSQADIDRLPSQLQDVVDDFKAAGNVRPKSNDILGALKGALENGLKASLANNEFVQGELTGDLAQLVSFSQTGLQVQQLLEARTAQSAVSFADAAGQAQAALAQADLSVPSQIAAFQALKQAANVAKTDAPDTAQLLGGIVKDRTKLLRKVADQTVKHAEQRVKSDGSLPNQQRLAASLQAAIDVNQALNPKSVKLKSLQKKLDGLGIDLPQQVGKKQPFFARFLENQNAQVAQHGEPQPQTRPDVESPDDPANVTMKYPSDAEDGTDGMDMVTEKYPSDAEDGGTTEAPGGDYVTLKYPSDNEDGGDDVIHGPGEPRIDTAKFPSDAEDGGVDDGIGDMVTLKFPSDAEDGGDGGIGLIPEIAPEIIPELIPEIAPEIVPELIVEIAPELRPSGLGLSERAERRAVKAAIYGYGQLENEMKEIDDLLTRALVSGPQLDELNLARASIKALLAGGPTINARIGEIEDLMRRARFDEAGLAKITAELEALKSLGGIIGEHKKVADARGMQRDMRPEKSIEIGAHQLAFAGAEAVKGRMAELKTQLENRDQTTVGHPDMVSVEYDVLKALSHGHAQLSQSLADLQSLQIRATMTPEMSQELDMKMSVIRSLMNVTEGYKERMQQIDSTGPNPPQPVVEIAPEIMPELIVEIAPELRPGPVGLAKDIERAVMKAAFHGMETVKNRAEEIESLLQRARMSPDEYLKQSVMLEGMQTLYGGTDAIDTKIQNLESQLTRRGPMSPEQRQRIDLTLEVMQNVRQQLNTYQMDADALGRRRHRTPAEDIIMKHLVVAHHGGQAMLDRVVELSNQPELGGLRDVAVETMKLFYEGGPALEKELNKMRALETQLGGTQEALAPFYAKKDILEFLHRSISQFERRMNAIDNPPQPVVELAPELRPAVQPLPTDDE